MYRIGTPIPKNERAAFVMVLPVGLGGVVLVGSPDGFLHPLRINPPQLQGVVHATRHDLLSK